jgi:heterodisulfide reductase subunit A
MSTNQDTVLIVGAGPAGLSAALHLADGGVHTVIVDRQNRPGGNAADFTCKASPECVRCGACMVVDRAARLRQLTAVDWLAPAEITGCAQNGHFQVRIRKDGVETDLGADAIILATGFTPFDPTQKPYGYQRGSTGNVITHLELEAMLHGQGKVRRPSDGAPPETIAFIQCVGSRDLVLGRPWCSCVCCGSALRMARRIQHENPSVKATFFYIDVQSFSRNFDAVYADFKSRIRMIRTIPGDVVKTPDDKLRVGYFDPTTRAYTEEMFDLTVLTVGMGPNPDTPELARMFGVSLDRFGFLGTARNGVFVAGSAIQPMGISDSIASGAEAAQSVLEYLARRMR